MRQQGLQPNVITYNSLISACGKSGKAERALQFFAKMQQQGLRPNVITYNAVIIASPRLSSIFFYYWNGSKEPGISRYIPDIYVVFPAALASILSSA